MITVKKIEEGKQYTCGGRRVIGLRIVPRNGLGNLVTYPVKGSVVISEKPLRVSYTAWSEYGEADVVWHKGHNLVEVVNN